MKTTNDFYCDFVLNNKIAVRKIRETKDILAFYHTKPSWTIHIVIVPKQHIESLADLPDAKIVGEIFEIIRSIIQDLGFMKTNYKIITNGGTFQDSHHLHFHLVSGKPNTERS